MKVRLGKEVHVETPDEVGVLYKVLGAVSKSGSSMQAMVAYGQSGKGHFIMLTSDNTKAAKALQKLNYTIDEEDVIIVEFEDKKGIGASVAEKLAEAGISIHYTYAGCRGKNVILVANTTNNRKGVEVLSAAKRSAKKPSKKPSKKKKAKKSKKAKKKAKKSKKKKKRRR